MSVPVSPPLYLFPGLAADAGIFTLQKLAFPGLVVPPWLEPKNRETLGEYARRFADEVKIPPGAILGGSSFGGILALEVARSVRPAAVVLIGSLHEPAAFPYRWGIFRPVKPVCRFLPVRVLQWAAYPATTAMARRRLPRVATLMRQFRQAEPHLFRWSVEQLLAWREPPELTCPVYRIHGDRDWVLPLPKGAGRDGVDIVEGGGHILSVSHPGRVNAVLRQAIEAVVANTPKGQPSATSVTAAEADGSP